MGDRSLSWREQDFTILVTGGAHCGREVQANFAVDIRTCGKPELDTLKLNQRSDLNRQARGEEARRPTSDSSENLALDEIHLPSGTYSNECL